MMENAPEKNPKEDPIPEPTPEEKSRAASILGRAGGSKGGAARAKRLSPERRKQIAKKAADERWKTREPDANEIARRILDEVCGAEPKKKSSPKPKR